MKDRGKGGEDRVKGMKREQQEEIDQNAPEKPASYPAAPGNPEKKDVPPGT
jgi:hypothetical protein